MGGLLEVAAPKKKPTLAFGAKKLSAAALANAVDGEIEVTLDDLWRVDLRERLGGWEQLSEGTWKGQVWKGEAEEESSEEEGEEDEDEEDDDEEEDEEEEEEEGGGSKAASAAARSGGGGGGGVSVAEAEARHAEQLQKISASAARHARSQAASTPEALRARELREALGLEDAASTPQPGEDLRAFFGRTAGTWVAELKKGFITGLTYTFEEAAAGEGGEGEGEGGQSSAPPTRQLTHAQKRALAAEQARRAAALREGEKVLGKEVKRRAFKLARGRYEEVWPQLAELYEMEQAQQEFEKELQRKLEEEARERAEKAARKARQGKGKGGGRR
jgi:hypothetical protein